MKKQKVNKKQIEQLAKRAAEVLAQLDEMKPLYNELDKLTDELVKLNGVGGIGDLVLIDNFLTKNTVFKTTSVKRYELKKVG